MNAPTAASHLLPEIHLRGVPQALIDPGIEPVVDIGFALIRRNIA